MNRKLAANAKDKHFHPPLKAVDEKELKWARWFLGVDYQTKALVDHDLNLDQRFSLSSYTHHRAYVQHRVQDSIRPTLFTSKSTKKGEGCNTKRPEVGIKAPQFGISNKKTKNCFDPIVNIRNHIDLTEDDDELKELLSEFEDEEITAHTIITGQNKIVSDTNAFANLNHNKDIFDQIECIDLEDEAKSRTMPEIKATITSHGSNAKDEPWWIRDAIHRYPVSILASKSKATNGLVANNRMRSIDSLSGTDDEVEMVGSDGRAPRYGTTFLLSDGTETTDLPGWGEEYEEIRHLLNGPLAPIHLFRGNFDYNDRVRNMQDAHFAISSYMKYASKIFPEVVIMSEEGFYKVISGGKFERQLVLNVIATIKQYTEKDFPVHAVLGISRNNLNEFTNRHTEEVTRSQRIVASAINSILEKVFYE